jgi:lysophospholipase L1-like esterase
MTRSICHARALLYLSLGGLFLLGQACGSSDGAGTVGTGGRGGAAGTTGAAGAAGMMGGSGATGTAGTSGAAGTIGAAGTGGSTGNAGTTGGAAGGSAGTTGVAGAGGASGRGGASGVAGNGGRGGATGVAGAGGASGQGGGIGGRGGGAGGSGGSGGQPDGGGSDGGASDGARDGSADGGGGYLHCPTTAGSACTVLPLGDSITEGCCTSPYGGYRIELFRQAVTNRKNLTFVGTLMNGSTTVANQTFPKRHDGHGGYTIAGGGNGPIAGTVTDTALSMFHPNIVLLMIGTNDINMNIDVANAPTRLGQLIDEIITGAPAALVVVATIIPIAAPNADQRTKTYNAAIPGLVNARAAAGKHVVLLDNYAAFAKDQNYQTTLKADGLHPNDAGYVVLGQSFYSAIAALLPVSP